MELIITVLALLTAVYAVTPRERQLDLRLRIGVFDWLVIAAGFLLVICLEFRNFRIARGWFLTTRPLPVGITPKNSMYYLVLLAVTAFVALRIRFSRLTKGKIYKFRELVEELYWAGSYGELFTLIQIAVSEHVGSRLKHTLLDMIFELYFALRSSGKFDVYATVLLAAITQRKSYRQDDPRYREVVATVFDEEKSEYHIKHPEEHVSELEAALKS